MSKWQDRYKNLVHDKMIKTMEISSCDCKSSFDICYQFQDENIKNMIWRPVAFYLSRTIKEEIGRTYTDEWFK